MKYLITGASGQLGYDIVNELKRRNELDYCAPTSQEMDITSKDKVNEVISKYKPDVIFHCAAYTAVDKAEDNKEICYDINVNGTRNIVETAKEYGAKVVYISTDYVFDGTKKDVYLPNDKPNPVNYYGYTKLCGEEIVSSSEDNLIVRISWVFGINGNNFVKTMLRLAETRSELSVVSDQIGSPTYTEDLSKLLVDMVKQNKRGIFHATNEGYCTWNEFARYIFEITGKEVIVNEILTKDYKTVATRPLNSKLSKDKLDEESLERLPTWQDATTRFCKLLRKEK